MKLGELLIQLQKAEQKVSVYDEIIEYLQRDGLEIPTASGDVPADVVEDVVQELIARKAELSRSLGAAEDVEIPDAQLETLGGSRSAD